MGKLIIYLCIIRLTSFAYKIFGLHSIDSGWHKSRNSNYFNPSLGATVYACGEYWNIVRYNNYYAGYEYGIKRHKQLIICGIQINQHIDKSISNRY